MVDVAVLGFDIRSDSAVKAEGDLRRMAGASQIAEDAARDLAMAHKVADASMMGAATSARAAGAAFGGGAHGMRNLSLQLSQVAQQGAVTGNYLSALAIQMPDILLSFGLWGTLIGAALAVAAPFAMSLFDTADAAETANDRIADLADALDRLDQAIAINSLSAQELAEKYGALDEAVQRFTEGIDDRAAAEAIRAAKEAVEAYASAIAEIDEAAGFINQFNAAIDAGREAPQFLADAFAAIPETMVVAADALTRFRDAASLDEQITAALDLQDALDGMNDVSFAPLTAGLDELIGKLLELRANTTLRFGVTEAPEGQGLAGLPGADLLPPPTLRPVRRSGGGGGGGLTEEEQERNRLLREAERILRATRTPQEQYNEGVASLNTLLEGGYINQETYNRALADLNETLPGIARAISGVADSVESELSSAFRAVMDGTKSLGNALLDFANNVLFQVAEDIFRETVGRSISSGLSGFLGGLFDGIGGGLFGGAAQGMAGIPAKAEAQAITINVTSDGGQRAEVQQRGNTIDVMLKSAVRAVAADISSGGEAFNAISKTFAIRPALGRR